MNCEEVIFKREKPLTCNLVLKERGWILDKFAQRLAENLPQWNIKPDIVMHSSSNAAINHWMYYGDTDGTVYQHDTLFITHVDRPAKFIVLKEHLKKAAMGICMSKMTVCGLINEGINQEQLCFISPAHDGLIKPRRIVIGITSRRRKDKAKGENILMLALEKMRFDTFHFEIIGRGWEEIINRLKEAGATVQYYPGTDSGSNDYEINIKQVPTFDYYLYLGHDEGSMGFLDALAAGVPTIVTPQGFHLDIENGITYSFANADELCVIFKKIDLERQKRIASVANLTWNEYARKHAIIWHSIAAGQQKIAVEYIQCKNILLPENKTKNVQYKLFRHRNYLNNFVAISEDAIRLFELYTSINFWECGPISFLKKIKKRLLGRKKSGQYTGTQ